MASGLHRRAPSSTAPPTISSSHAELGRATNEEGSGDSEDENFGIQSDENNFGDQLNDMVGSSRNMTIESNSASQRSGSKQKRNDDGNSSRKKKEGKPIKFECFR